MKRYTEEVKGEKITYWRSIENRTRTINYLKSIENEFVDDLTEITSMDRRSMLKVMGASIALSGIGLSCRRPEEKILPYVKHPESITPGIPNFFATSRPDPFGASSILVESHEGRPTKVEGNPLSTNNNGKATIFDQASILDLYDPDRSKFVWQKKAGIKQPKDWADFDQMMSEVISEYSKNQGEGLALLFDLDLSPTILRLKEDIRKKYPKVRFYTHEPLRQINIEDATNEVFGKHTRVKYNLKNTKIICSIFSDFLAFGPEQIKMSNDFAKNRQIYSKDDITKMNRLYSVEADYSLVGTNADHRMKIPLGYVKKFIEALAYELHASFGIDIPKDIANNASISDLISRPPSYKGLDKNFIFTLAKDLAQNKGKSLLIAGDHLSKEIISVIHLLNLALDGYNNTFQVLHLEDDPIKKHLSEPDLLVLNEDAKNNKISTLFIFAQNPIYTCPSSINFNENFEKINNTIHIGLSADETAALSSWHVPKTHFLEHFSDTRSFDGSICFIQPLIFPLHNSKSEIQILAALLGNQKQSNLEIIKATHSLNQKDFDKYIHNGFIENSTFNKLNNFKFNGKEIFSNFNAIEYQNINENNFELIINFDRKILDGRFSNNSWLQELPDSVSKTNWDNALFMSPKLAKNLQIRSGLNKNSYVADIVSVSVENKKIELPVFIIPGLSDFSLVTTLGYGREKAGYIGNNVGFNNYKLLPDFRKKYLYGIKISKTGKTYRISTTQEQFAMNGDVIQDQDILSLQNRDPARESTIKNYSKNPNYAKEKEGLPDNLKNLQITKQWDYSSGNQWGMVIDLTKCTGCNACVIACQSENNIPVVGKEEVIRGRIMHWIRLDRYFTGDVHAPKSVAQPIPCQHCENAPCEPVCPVAATVHDKEGLNAMTYNRCIGTRYCANNCPYKVRRFNYFDFSNTGNLYVEQETKERQKTLKLQRNPDVTVRYRGVMEKCTYCSQRIQEAKAKARRENKDPNQLEDGSVIPACSQTCPTEAITFGNIIDEKSQIFMLKNLDRNYTMLDVLNVRPRTSYLSKLRNPHPDLV